MDSRVLLVLMWKHGVVRLRRFILTFVECVAPLIFFILLFATKDSIKPDIKNNRPDDFVAKTELLPLVDPKTDPRMIMYHPDSRLAGELMAEVAKQFDMEKLDHIPNRIAKGYYLPYTNDSQLSWFVAEMDRYDAVIIFQGLEGETWPSKLNYTIRMKDEFSTDGYEPEDSTPGPHRRFGLNYGVFMRVQWAVDTSYVKTFTGGEIKQTIYLREFPYYYTVKSGIMELVCSVCGAMCWLSLLIPFVFLMARLINERTSGIQELMKMVGVSIQTLGLSHAVNSLPIGLLFAGVVTGLLKATSNPLITNSNGFLIFLLLILYFNSIIALAFACSYITKTSQYSTTLSVTAYIVVSVPELLLTNYKVPYVLTLAAGVLPHIPLGWFWKECMVLEVYGSGITFQKMLTAKHHNNGSVLLAYIFLIIQAVLYYLLAWYLSYVLPGKYGQALPWNFPFKKHFWNKNEVTPTHSVDEEVLSADDDRYFEAPPQNMEVGIKIVNVSKVYPKQVALKNVSLEVYKGEITVLLGHNGAGKTTLMSIITGMTSATSGHVLVSGKDTVTQRAQVRQHLGLCPQHNLFFPDLTVNEHVMLFTMLKKGTFAEARQTSKKLIEQLGLSGKLSSLVAELSGGMKRRVQLACALAGDADVLILDEPTSGLDVETRRGLWDLLLSLRGDRTVMLTTHFMEEADALGDRVAALHCGQLRCAATTMHLKKARGTGYRLTLTTIGAPNEAGITALVTSHVRDAAVRVTSLASVSYSLPSHAASHFPLLFAALEENRSQLGIDSIGVGVSTLEEVFLKLCSDIDANISEDEVDSAPTSDPTTKRLTGFPLYIRQLKVLLKRQVKYAYSRKWIFLLLQVIIPLVIMYLITHSANYIKITYPDAMALNLDVYKDMPERRVLYNIDSDDVTISAFKLHYPSVKFQPTTDVASKILEIGKEDILEYNKYLVGVELNDENATALFTTTVRHAAPVSLNLLSNLMSAQYIPGGDPTTITTHIQPYLTNYQLEKIPEKPKETLTACLWAIFIVFIILSTTINSVSLPCKERESGSRHIHIMCGCAPEVYWGSTALAHTVLCATTLVLPAALAAYVMDRDNTIDHLDFIGAFIVTLLFGSMAFLSFMYLISCYFSENTTNTLLVACIVIFGVFTPLIKTAQEFLNSDKSAWYVIVSIFEYTIPVQTLVTSAVQCVLVARLNTWCDILRENNNTRTLKMFLQQTETNFKVDQCLAGEYHCYFCREGYAPAMGMLTMVLQFLFYMTMVILTQRGMFKGLVDMVMNLNSSPSEAYDAEEMIRAEKTYVNKAIDLPTKQISDAMLVDDVHKTYSPCCRKRVNAVKGVSFSVKQGECFGLLGVNGAGKSTIFKLLTAEEVATRGRIFANGYYLKRGNSKYLQTLGYCPQFFGLDMFQTGEDNLALILTLRGLDQEWVQKEIKSWFDIIGVGKYASRYVSEYSGGSVRRLGCAAALCGGSGVVLLDEPTTGVDVTARRRLWAAIRRAQHASRAVLITSHSMDEMEALCSRIAIMSMGQVRTLGSAAALRARHAQGHAVVFKLNHARAHAAEDQVDGAKPDLHLLKGKLHETFDCALKDEHQTMLHYHINETLPYSSLFSSLETLKQQFPRLVEDYAVTETTLEEVFLSFAKEERSEV